MKIRKFFLLSFILLVSILFSSVQTLAATNYKELEPKTGIDQHHDFTVLFNQELDEESVSQQNIYVEYNSKIVDGITVSLNADQKSVKVTAPAEGYQAGETYFIYVEKDVKSKDDRILQDPVEMKFTVNNSIDTVQYFPVTGSSTVSAGIYKAEPNGVISLVQKEDSYQLDWGEGSIWNFDYVPPVTPFKLDDMNMYAIKSGISTTYGDDYSNVYDSIKFVQPVSSDLYYTKFYFTAQYIGGPMGGGGADILEIYKRDSQGEIVKVTDDTVSSNVTTPFYVSGHTMYYAKIENELLKNYSLVQMDLTTGKKTTIASNIEDFWVNQNTMYYIQYEKYGSNEVHTMNVEGEKTGVIHLQNALYGISPVEDGNYSVTENGILISDWDAEAGMDMNYFYDFKTESNVTLPLDKLIESTGYDYYVRILDVDTQGKRLIAALSDDETNETIIGLYDLKGNLIESITTSEQNIFSIDTLLIDAVKGEFLYVDGNTLKSVKF